MLSFNPGDRVLHESREIPMTVLHDDGGKYVECEPDHTCETGVYRREWLVKLEMQNG